MLENEVVQVLLSPREIRMLLNAINETMEAVEDWEFSTRVGCEPGELEALREKLDSQLSPDRD